MHPIKIGLLTLALGTLPLTAFAQQNGQERWQQHQNRGNNSTSCSGGQAQSCLSGQITRIDGQNVYVNTANGSVHVNDQALWQNNRQDMQLVNGQNVTFGGYQSNGTFVATSLAGNGAQTQTYSGNTTYNGNPQGTYYGCGNGQGQSCVSGQITRIDGKNVYLNTSNGAIRVYDQPLWDNNREDMQLVNGRATTFGGYFSSNAVFVATRIVANGQANGNNGYYQGTLRR
jgi:hypothetical protein